MLNCWSFWNVFLVDHGLEQDFNRPAAHHQPSLAHVFQKIPQQTDNRLWDHMSPVFRQSRMNNVSLAMLDSPSSQVQDLLATDVLVKRLRYQDAEEVVLNDSVWTCLDFVVFPCVPVLRRYNVTTCINLLCKTGYNLPVSLPFSRALQAACSRVQSCVQRQTWRQKKVRCWCLSYIVTHIWMLGCVMRAWSILMPLTGAYPSDFVVIHSQFHFLFLRVIWSGECVPSAGDILRL